MSDLTREIIEDIEKRNQNKIIATESGYRAKDQATIIAELLNRVAVLEKKVEILERSR